MPTHAIASYTKSERLFILYQRLPRDKAKAIALTELMSVYGDNPDRFASERKNLENDLTSLKNIFDNIFHSDALVRVPAWEQNISGKTARYYIEDSFNIDLISEQTLFFWEMLKNYTAHYLPVAMQQIIADKLSQIKRQDKQAFANSELGQWHNSLITLPSVVQAPTLNSEVLASIHQALLQNCQLKIIYRKKWKDSATEKLIYPRGLVFIDNMMYLTGFYLVEDQIDDAVLLKAHRNFAISRIVSATVIDEPIANWVERECFTLESLQQLGKLEFTDNTEMKLILKVQKFACQHLYERPLAQDQQIIIIDDTWNEVSVTVANTQRLQDWLVSMSQLAVVVEPLELKAIILERLHSAFTLYKN